MNHSLSNYEMNIAIERNNEIERIEMEKEKQKQNNHYNYSYNYGNNSNRCNDSVNTTNNTFLNNISMLTQYSNQSASVFNEIVPQRELSKINIMEVIDSERLNEQQQIKDKRDNDITANDQDVNEYSEPMTFKPRLNCPSKSSDNNNDLVYAFGVYKTNQCSLILKVLKEQVYEQYLNLCYYYDNIKKADINDNNNTIYQQHELIQLVNNTYEQIHCFENAMNNIISSSKSKLNTIKNEYAISNSNSNNNNCINEMQESLRQIVENSFSYQPQLSNVSSELDIKLLSNINHIEQLENIYKTKLNNYEAKFKELTEQIIYYQQIINQSKNLIDDLSNQNKLITAKLIKYKQIAEQRNLDLSFIASNYK